MVKYQFIQQLRKHRALSQDFVASTIEVSRPTYIKIEKGEAELTLEQAQRLAAVFGISLDALTRGGDEQYEVTLESEKAAATQENSMRVVVPKENARKFKETLLYILNKVGGKPNVGMTVLYKLLYFIDFDYYEKFEEPLIGAKYIRNHFGPTPVAFSKIVAAMEGKELVTVQNKYFDKDQKRFLPLREPDLSVLNAKELAHIDEVLGRLSNRTATDLSRLSHKDVPWIIAKDNMPIEYEAVFYRTSETSVRKYDDDQL